MRGGFGKWTLAPDFPHRMADTGRLRALVAKREWNEIEDIARAKRSPIGWEVSAPAKGPVIDPLLIA